MNEDNRVELVAGLFAALKHGDQDHQDWLFEAIGAFFAGEPVPVPRGAGNKEKRIAELEAAIASLQGADTVTEADRRSLAYSVANAKLGEGPSVCCEGPTEFEVNVARQWIDRVLNAMRTAAPTAQDDNGVRIEAQGDDALIETLRLLVSSAMQRGIKPSLAVDEIMANNVVRAALSSRLSADHTAASPDVPRHE